MSLHGLRVFPARNTMAAALDLISADTLLAKPPAEDGNHAARARIGPGPISLLIAILLAISSVLPAHAQYSGKVTKKSESTPDLRAIAILEWTGDEGKPKASRLVPILVYDASQSTDHQLQDAGIYLSRPVPMALSGSVIYELQKNGKPLGLYEVLNAGKEQGSWVGHGSWKPLPAAKPKPSAQQLAQIPIEDTNSDRPVLHRKKHAGDISKSTPSSPGAGSTSSGPAPDPDRPTLHKKTSSSDDSASSGSDTSSDPDRPKLKKNNKKQTDVAHVDSLPEVTDTERPRLMRGKPTSDNLVVAPTLVGLPAEMNQTVAVSDAKTRNEHVWNYTWANPEDENKMKTALEEIARQELGIATPTPAATPAASTSRRSTARKKVKIAPAIPDIAIPGPAPLAEERFHVFELAYGSGATLVLTARTDAPLAQQRYVTLIAKPNLYGNVLVLFKQVTDNAHLDVKPRMQFIDAVDALADNRGELLFELRGRSQRQFALYRVLHGQAQQIFITGSGEIAVGSSE
jgi:hypothetical protein